MERLDGYDPSSSLWQREILPFNYRRIILGAGRDSRNPLCAAWKAGDSPWAYLHLIRYGTVGLAPTLQITCHIDIQICWTVSNLFMGGEFCFLNYVPYRRTLVGWDSVLRMFTIHSLTQCSSIWWIPEVTLLVLLGFNQACATCYTKDPCYWSWRWELTP